jgi:hypothetical protein
MEEQTVLFDPRFLGKHAGAIITDPGVALVELVANTWDSYATDVAICWPNPRTKTCFSIRDNGTGMTPEQFERRWITLDYDRVEELGRDAEPPPELASEKPRPTYGRNGRGRYAAFLFSSPYELRTWRDGIEVTYKVSRGTSAPLELKLVKRRTKDVVGHGTEIRALNSDSVGLTAEQAREVLGARFLTDPQFRVSIDGTIVGFDDIPDNMLQEASAQVLDLADLSLSQGSLQRPDFVIIPDGSVGFYSRDSYGEDYEVEGVESLVIAEIKKPGIAIGTQQLDQALGYATELIKRGSITPNTPVACFVLGSKLLPIEAEETKRGRVTITPMAYDTFIRRAEKRMLGLREKLKGAPFLQGHGLDAEGFLTPPQPKQPELWSVNELSP